MGLVRQPGHGGREGNTPRAGVKGDRTRSAATNPNPHQPASRKRKEPAGTEDGGEALAAVSSSSKRARVDSVEDEAEDTPS